MSKKTFLGTCKDLTSPFRRSATGSSLGNRSENTTVHNNSDRHQIVGLLLRYKDEDY